MPKVQRPHPWKLAKPPGNPRRASGWLIKSPDVFLCPDMPWRKREGKKRKHSSLVAYAITIMRQPILSGLSLSGEPLREADMDVDSLLAFCTCLLAGHGASRPNQSG